MRINNKDVECRRLETIAIISCRKYDPNHPSESTLDTLEKHSVSRRCTEPNWYCHKYFANDNLEPPCIKVSQMDDTIEKERIPRDIKIIGEKYQKIPKKIIFGKELNERSICIDIFPSGENEIKIYKRGKCRYGEDDILI